MKSRTLGASVGLAIALASGASHAQAGKSVFTLPAITITGRIQKPLATVEVARIEPAVALRELRRPFTDRIEHAVTRDPY